jgi:heptosyltransferase-3
MRYDLAVSTRTSDRETLFARAAGRRAISLVPPARPEDAWKRWALSGFHPHDEETHVVDELFRLLDVVGVPPVRDWRIPVSSNVTHRVTGRYAVMHLFPRNLYKSWTPEGWCRVGRHLSDRGLKIVILGGRGEEERSQISDVVGMMSGDVISLAGATTFAEIAELLGGCDVYVGPDTAMTHLAAAVGAPTVALVGPTNLRRYAPYDMHGDATGSRIRLVVGPCTCGRPEIGCAAHAALRGACMETIAPEAVVEAIDGILRRQFPALCPGGGSSACQGGGGKSTSSMNAWGSQQ